jgi:hypothetical protein
MASWRERVKSLAKDRGWVLETGTKCTTVDVVELLPKDPFVLCVINLEAAIRRNTSSSAEFQGFG